MKMLLSVIVASMAISLSSTMLAQPLDSLIQKFERRSHTFNMTTLPYRLFIPEEYDSTQSYPLMLSLHGAGERGTDNDRHIRLHGLATSWVDTVSQAANPLFVVAPQCPVNNRWADVDWAVGTYFTDSVSISNELEAVLNLLDSLINEFNIDVDRQYVTGLSMGGYGTWDLIARFPERFAAAIPMSGGGDSSKVALYQNTATWNWHGAIDVVVPPTGSRAIVTAMNQIGLGVIEAHGMPDSVLAEHIANGAKHIYTEYPTGNHVIWQESYDHPLLPDWLFSKSRDKSVGINSTPIRIPQSIKLHQNYPNPFNPQTTIGYELTDPAEIKISVYEVTGKHVADLVSGYQHNGAHQVQWNAENLATGIYIYQVIVDGNPAAAKKMLLIK